MDRSFATVLAFLAVWALAPTSQAAAVGLVEARLPSGRVALADYHAGKTGRPAVIVLHGFLQTKDFPTVSSIVSGLATADYSVLAPTLSLGIPRRNKSLPCEAIHTHTLDDDVAEVRFWVDWLQRKGHRRIVLVGHSFGNLQLLTYLRRSPSPAITQFLMISLTDVESRQSAQERVRLAERLRARAAEADRGLSESAFSHCKKYVSPPRALLSYLSMSRASILDDVAGLSIKTGVILGGKDDRMGADWGDKLAARGIAVRVIPDASHFFDNQFEFDLQDAVLQAVRDR